MKSNIKVGTWRVDITPPVGNYVCCGFIDKPIEEIWDSIYTRAIVIDDGNTEAAIINVDACAIPDKLCFEIIEEIEKKCLIPERNIIIAATHTDKSPVLGKVLDDNTKLDLHYIETFKKDVVTAVYMAKKKKQQAIIGVGRGEDNQLVFNRRLKKPDGSIVMNFADPEFLKDCLPNDLVDREIITVRFDGEDSRPIAIIVNYANHNNAAGGLPVITPDYMGYTEKLLQKLYGENLTVLFLPGACGDVNWINHKETSRKSNISPLDKNSAKQSSADQNPVQNQDDKSLLNKKLIEKFGLIITGIVMGALSKAEYKEIDSIEAISHKIMVKDRPFREIDTREDDSFGPGKKGGIEFATFKNEKKLATGKELAVNEITLNALRLGADIAIVTNPGELFVELGLEIKKQSPFRYTIISELTNGYKGYICTRAAYDEGGYEARRTSHSSHLDIDSGEKVVKACVELLNAL